MAYLIVDAGCDKNKVRTSKKQIVDIDYDNGIYSNYVERELKKLEKWSSEDPPDDGSSACCAGMHLVSYRAWS